MARSKLYRARLAVINPTQAYPLDQAVKLLKQMPPVKFNESVELAFRLGIDPKQTDQAIRGALALPHGTGRSVRVIVVATGDAANAAKAAGADEVGFDELIEKIKGGWMDFDVVIATPACMTKVRTLGKQLGPRGLMPNPKTGTVTDDVAAAVKETKGGRVEYRSDKGGCAHVPVGKVSFTEAALVENADAVVQAILRARPAKAKGVYLLSCTLSATMSPGIKLDPRLLARS